MTSCNTEQIPCWLSSAESNALVTSRIICFILILNLIFQTSFFIFYGRKDKLIPSVDLSMSLLFLLLVNTLTAFVQPNPIHFFHITDISSSTPLNLQCIPFLRPNSTGALSTTVFSSGNDQQFSFFSSFVNPLLHPLTFPIFHFLISFPVKALSDS